MANMPAAICGLLVAMAGIIALIGALLSPVPVRTMWSIYTSGGFLLVFGALLFLFAGGFLT